MDLLYLHDSKDEDIHEKPSAAGDFAVFSGCILCTCAESTAGKKCSKYPISITAFTIV